MTRPHALQILENLKQAEQANPGGDMSEAYMEAYHRAGGVQKAETDPTRARQWASACTWLRMTANIHEEITGKRTPIGRNPGEILAEFEAECRHLLEGLAKQ